MMAKYLDNHEKKRQKVSCIGSEKLLVPLYEFIVVH
jgi:hypothetical protein